jgi:hypothetical protein
MKLLASGFFRRLRLQVLIILAILFCHSINVFDLQIGGLLIRLLLSV